MDKKSKTIKSLVVNYCEKHLNEEYLQMCTKVHEDLILEDENIFKRGKAEIWAAAIVWAIGSLNFLGDKSFEPYATLSDVCDCFGANSSTVGQKTRIIKDWLDISLWSSEYRLPNTGIGDFLDNLVMTDDGFIVTKDLLEDNKEENEIELVEDNDPVFLKIVFSVKRKVSNAQIYQLEYTLKKLLEEEEEFRSFEINNNRELVFTYYGFSQTIVTIKEKIKFTDFEIKDIYYADDVDDLV